MNKTLLPLAVAFAATAHAVDFEIDLDVDARPIMEGLKPPKVKGEVEWLALADARRNELCLLMVNTKSFEEMSSARSPTRRWLPAIC